MSEQADGRGGGHLDEGTVHAWLDAQLSAADAARVEAHMVGCPACAALVAEARGHIAAATRILNTLDGVPVRVLPRRDRRVVHRWHLRAAAAIIVMALGTAVVIRGPHTAMLRSTAEPRSPVLGAVPDSAPAGGALRQRTPRASEQETAAPSANAAARERRSPPAPAPSASPAAPGHVPQRALDLEAKAATTPPPPEARAQLSRALTPTPLPAAAGSATSDAPAGGLPLSPSAARLASPPSENALAAKKRRFAPMVGGPAAADSARWYVTGRVTDSAGGMPVAAASVIVSGTTVGQNTSDSGTFALAVPRDAKSITVRRIGYLAQTVPIDPGVTSYSIPLQKDVLRLEAQVVTGAATSASSENAANAVSVVTSQDVNQVPAPTIQNAVRGQALPPSGGAAPRASSTGPVRVIAPQRCLDRVLHVATTGGAGTAATAHATIRLTDAPSTLPGGTPGFVVRAVPDTAAGAIGRWQPVGRDSALVEIPGQPDTVRQRVSCGAP